MSFTRCHLIVIRALAVAAVLPSLLVPARPSDAQAGVIKIATQSPLSGPAAALGEGIRNGALLAATPGSPSPPRRSTRITTWR